MHLVVDSIDSGNSGTKANSLCRLLSVCRSFCTAKYKVLIVRYKWHSSRGFGYQYGNQTECCKNSKNWFIVVCFISAHWDFCLICMMFAAGDICVSQTHCSLLLRRRGKSSFIWSLCHDPFVCQSVCLFVTICRLSDRLSVCYDLLYMALQ